MHLGPESHTVRRLEHANATHLHATTTRTFIGPVPEGWLNSHRKQWYKRHIIPSSLPFSHHSASRSSHPTFTAAQPVAAAPRCYDGAEERAEAAVERSRSAEGGDGSVQAAPTSNDGTLDSMNPPRPSDQSAMSSTAEAEAEDSHTSLLRRQHRSQQGTERLDNPAETTFSSEEGGKGKKATDLLLRFPAAPAVANLASSKPRVRFNEVQRFQMRSRAALMGAKGKFRRKGLRDGEVLKVDKMLVRTDATRQVVDLAGGFDEKVARGVEGKVIEGWREVMVVARACSNKGQEKRPMDEHPDMEGAAVDADAVLQFYETRVIASEEKEGNRKKKPKVELMLDKRAVGVDLYSSLDKTLSVWTTAKGRTTLYYLRPQSGATSVEWYTFLRAALGYKRSTQLQVHIPDLSVSLRLTDPFRVLEASRAVAEAAEGDEAALAKAVTDEQGAAGAIVERCFEMLKQSSDWHDVLKAWAQHGRVGLVWRRYDRLEWVYGAVEQKMYGTIGMQKTHELELRPKDHYPTIARKSNAPPKIGEDDALHEPPPVEGFLIRLTSQQGHDRRMGKMLFKRLYFTSQDRYLIFLRPSRATPPPPPKLPQPSDGDNIPSKQQLLDETPISYDIEPFPLTKPDESASSHTQPSITWLDNSTHNAHEQATHDTEAASEAARNTDMLLSSDGFISLTDIKLVRNMQRGATPADDNLDEGPDVDFHTDVSDCAQDDGATEEIDDDRIFELLLKNGLVIRLQAYNAATKKLWQSNLRALITYWKARTAADMSLHRQTRATNLKALNIDERAEAYVGQFAYKWEVSASHASPQIYNLCGISACRPIHHAGVLYRKPRRHTTFTRAHVILSAGHMLVFQDTLRKSTGKKLVHIHHERISSLDLRGCYVYSGSLAEADLLYANRTFDSSAPGSTALPRMYLEDDWSSIDEDATCCFVLWQNSIKGWFRSSATTDDARESAAAAADGAGSGGKSGGKLKRVGKLGTKGRTVVFKARSRAERDHWVLAVQVEIERLAALEGLEGPAGGVGGDVRLEG